MIAKGIGVFIIQDNKLLLTKRLQGVQAGLWEVVAGGIEPGETGAVAAAREALEETRLTVKITKYLGKNIDTVNQFESEMFLAEIQSGELSNTEPRAHATLKWFALDSLPQALGTTTKAGLLAIRNTNSF
jgi:8-oxo-dGTP pyrophosphatase MutT (NUDIX family)